MHLRNKVQTAGMHCEKTIRMKKENLPLIIIIASLLLIILNFIFTSNETNHGFWMQISSSVLLIFAMIVTIRDRKKIKTK